MCAQTCSHTICCKLVAVEILFTDPVQLAALLNILLLQRAPAAARGQYNNFTGVPPLSHHHFLTATSACNKLHIDQLL